MLLRHRRLSIRPRRCSGRSKFGGFLYSCVSVMTLQGHKVTVVILGCPRRLVEADRRHGAPVETAEVRDVDLGAGPLHRHRGELYLLVVSCAGNYVETSVGALNGLAEAPLRRVGARGH